MTSQKKGKEQEKRIAALFPAEWTDHGRSLETLKHYKKYLEDHLTLPVRVTGAEDFPWEEFYVLGPGDKQEYEELKKTRPSYTDTFDLLKIEKQYEDFYGLFASVRRLADKKRFSIPLEQLEATDRRTSAVRTVKGLRGLVCQ
jgi:hypothetical protein